MSSIHITRTTSKTAQEARKAIIESGLDDLNNSETDNTFASKSIKAKKQKSESSKKKKEQKKLLEDRTKAKDQLEEAYSSQAKHSSSQNKHSSAFAPSLPPSKSSPTVSTSTSKSIASVLPSTSAASSLTLPPSLDLIVNRVNVSQELSSINPTSSSEVNSLDKSETTAKTVLKFMLDQMKKDKFPKKVFKNGDKTFGYSAVLQFTKSKTAVTKGEVICFVCVFCGSKTNAILGSTSNVNGHFDSCHKDTFKDKDFLVWYNGYKATHPSVQNKTLITRETLNIVKYFISSNTALKEFDSVHFRELFSNYSFKIPCARTFSDVILTSVFEKMNAITF